ncbi:MAG: hypothetical protein HDQ98_09150 [Lachnospiraceae bacterium]|nr:hypothetical protein [Lachnospiraceae bacterium]
MRNKILLEIYLPAAERSFEVRIPLQLKVAQATVMLVEFLKKREGEYVPTEECVLWDLEGGRGLDPNAFVAHAGLHNGAKVMLI